MKASEIEQIAKQVEELATLAGIRGSITDDGKMFRATFEIDGGRSQLVVVKCTGGSVEKPLLSVESRAILGKKGLLGGLSGKIALELLRINHTSVLAKFAMRESDSQYEVYAVSDHLLPTLDAEEFRAACWRVAQAADAVELKFQKGDDF